MMGKIERQAGRFTATAYTDGWPISTLLQDANFQNSTELLHLSLDDLEDLHYVAGRMIKGIRAANREMDKKRGAR